MNEEESRVRRPHFDKLVLNMDEQLELYLRTPRRVQKRLQGRGLKPMDKPERERPQLTKQISRMTNEELGDFQGYCAVWEAYVGEKVGEVETEMESLKGAKNALLAALKDEFEQQNIPVSARGDRAKSDTRYEHMESRWIEANSELKQLKEMLTGLEKQRKACSRYVEIRTKEIEADKRNTNIGRRRRNDRRAFK